MNKIFWLNWVRVIIYRYLTIPILMALDKVMFGIHQLAVLTLNLVPIEFPYTVERLGSDWSNINTIISVCILVMSLGLRIRIKVFGSLIVMDIMFEVWRCPLKVLLGKTELCQTISGEFEPPAASDINTFNKGQRMTKWDNHSERYRYSFYKTNEWMFSFVRFIKWVYYDIYK